MYLLEQFTMFATFYIRISSVIADKIADRIQPASYILKKKLKHKNYTHGFSALFRSLMLKAENTYRNMQHISY